MDQLQQVAEIIKRAGEVAVAETADTPPSALFGKVVEFPTEVTLGRGLEGAIACNTKVGFVDGAKGWIIYGGYNVFDLSLNSDFEETTYLLLFGRLPSRAEYEEFCGRLTAARAVPQQVLDTLAGLPQTTHPMAMLRTGVSLLGCLDPKADRVSVENDLDIAVRLVSQFATLGSAVGRLRRGQAPIAPRDDLGHTANFLYMLEGREPDPVAARVMDIALILHADHGMNASTFTSMVINSSETDLYSSIVGGIGSLKGPLHGGANELVLYDLEEIGSPENAPAWYQTAREKKRKVMGFGHRVYKVYDPRARILGPLVELVCRDNPQVSRLYETATALEKLVIADLGASKSIFPNVDFYSGLIYRAFGFDTPMFTPIFAVSRVSGWCARVIEYLAENRIFRPRAVYHGPTDLSWAPFDARP